MSVQHGAPSPTVDGALQRNIRDIDIPPRPRVIDRIHAEMQRDAPNLRALAGLIAADVSLAAGLIKTANSPYFGFSRHARSALEALAMLGLDVSCRAIAAISLRRAFPNSAQYERFWHASAQIAALSGWLAQQIPQARVRPDDAYTFGLFRDCGIVILLRRFPEYAGVLAQANQDAEQSFTARERQLLPTDHCVVGGLLARNWWLPDALCLAIAHHHDLPALATPDSPLLPASRPLIALAQIAEFLVQEITGGSRSEEWSKLGEVCLGLFGLSEAGLRTLYGEAESLLRSVE